MKKYIKNLQADLPASLVVFLVALPLCLGIALGSKVPLFSGIIAGVVGGIAIGFMSGSPLSVSGPAAGLTAIVAAAVLKLPTFESFLLAVVLAGILQVALGFLKAGILGDYVPNSVIKGMLAAIGIILILKQLPHLVGFDKDFLGDETFSQADNENTFSEIANALGFITMGPVIVGVISILMLILFERKSIKHHPILKQIPAPLLVVIMGLIANEIFRAQQSPLTIQQEHLVNLPMAGNLNEFISLFSKPDFTQINNSAVWSIALTLAIVASLETLLSIEAIDKIDPYKRVTPTNRELKAQGVGNIISGLLGGLPITSVIVRSSANVNAGGISKTSTIMHGILLFASVILIPDLLNKIPLAALAAILIFTGYKLAKIPMIKEFYQKGWDQFIPFIVTVIAILLSDLLIGIFIGAAVALFFMLRSNFRSSVLVVRDKTNYLLRLRKDVSFLNKPIIKRKLEEIPPNSYIIIDSSRADFIDKDIVDVINEYKQHAGLKNISVEIKKNPFNNMQDSL
jgi:MFS superfamily sulfate permease-like transporter